MHNEGVCAKEWTKHGPNLGVKTMFFQKTRRTYPENPENL